MSLDPFPYTVQLTDEFAVRNRFLSKASLLAPNYAARGVNEDELVAAVCDARAIAAYLQSIPVVKRFIEEEVDLTSSSTARLGLDPRVTEPRLGGYFQKRIEPGAQQMLLGVGIEDLIVGGFAAMAADPERPDYAWTRETPDDEERWHLLSHAIEAAPSGMLENVMDACEPERAALKLQADDLGITSGLTAFRKKAVVNANTFAFMEIGVWLWEIGI